MKKKPTTVKARARLWLEELREYRHHLIAWTQDDAREIVEYLLERM